MPNWSRRVEKSTAAFRIAAEAVSRFWRSALRLFGTSTSGLFVIIVCFHRHSWIVRSILESSSREVEESGSQPPCSGLRLRLRAGSYVQRFDAQFLDFGLLDIVLCFHRHSRFVLPFFDGTNPVSCRGREVAPPPTPPRPRRGAREFPALDKEGPGVVDFCRSFVFIDILALFSRFSMAQTRFRAKVSKSHHPQRVLVRGGESENSPPWISRGQEWSISAVPLFS